MFNVMVTGLDASVALAQDPRRPTPPATVSTPEPELVGPLRLRPAAREGICRGAQECVEVGFRLAEPAYVLVLSSDAGSLQPRDCSRGIRESQPGERWFRLRVGQAAHEHAQRPDAGLYVLAIKQRNLAYRVGSHVHRLCASGPRPALRQWATQLESLLDNHAYETAWRSIHLRRTQNGVVRL